ncbi:MAG TPA: amidohydrolase family protein [Nevskiaceae bacterium]
MTGTEERLSADELLAIDIHTHVLRSVAGAAEPDPATDFLVDVFKSDVALTLPEMVRYYRRLKMAFVTFSIDDPWRSGRGPAVSGEEIARIAAEHPDVVLPFVSVDPHRGAEGVRAARRFIEEHHVRGFKFHPSQQAFYPDDRMCYPLYEVLAEHRVPALFHTGQTAVGRGLPGGGGIRLKYSNPMHLDDVAVDFPDMPIILAHPSFPWQEEAISVALHKPQVYIDLSGWSPKYFPPILVQYMNTLLKDKMLFGSDFPALTPERWLRDFDQLDVKPGVRELILKGNAMRLLGWPLPALPR